MKIENLGTGCHNCLELKLQLAGLIRELGLTGVEILWVDDEPRIRRYIPPGLSPAWSSIDNW